MTFKFVGASDAALELLDEGTSIGQFFTKLNIVGPDISVAASIVEEQLAVLTVNGGAGVTGWTHAHPIVQLTDIADTVAIGAIAMSGGEKLRVVGSTRLEGDTVI